MNRTFNFSVGEFYHLYNRGTDKRVIFTDTYDYNRFIVLLRLCNSSMKVDVSNLIREGRTFTELVGFEVGETLVEIGAYCLMPNHFHILVREKSPDGTSLFMKKLATAYSMYFNKKHSRTGSLFEGKFKAKHADTDEYLKYLFAYIHLNPVKIIDPEWKQNGIKDKKSALEYLSTYRYSSYLEYIGKKRKEGEIINNKNFPDYFSGQKDFNNFVQEWLTFKDLS